MPAVYSIDDDITTRFNLDGPFSELPVVPLTPDEEGAYEIYTNIGFRINNFHPSNRWIWNPFSGGVGEWWMAQHVFLQYNRRDDTTNPNNIIRPSGWANNVGFSGYGSNSGGYFQRVVNASCSSFTSFGPLDTLMFDIEDDVTGNFRGTLLFDGADRGGETDPTTNKGFIFNEDRPPVIRYQGGVADPTLVLDTVTVVLEIVTVITPSFAGP